MFIMENNVHLLELSEYQRPEITEVVNREWVGIGGDNMYYQNVINAYMESTTNEAVINGIVDQIYGKGLDATDSNRKPDEYAKMRSLLSGKELRKVCQDLKLLGEGVLQISYVKGKMSKITHFPRETLRPEVCNEEGEIEAYFYTADWSKVTRNTEFKRIPVFGSGEENELYIVRRYVPGYFYVSPIDYQISYATLEKEISDYLINDCINGFSGTKILNFNSGIPDIEKQQEIKNKVLDKLTGSNGEKVIVSFNNNAEGKATIDDVSLTDAPDHYNFLSEECKKMIMLTHRVTSPLLLGLSSANGFSSNADEIVNASNLFHNVVIKPYQLLITESLEEIFATQEINLSLYFKTIEPLEFMEIETHVDKETIEEETGVKVEDQNGIEIKETENTTDIESVDASYNGAQISSAIDIVAKVKEGILSEAQAVVFLIQFLQLPEEVARGFFNSNTEQLYSKMTKKESNSKNELTKEEELSVLGSLETSGEVMSDDYVFVDEIDEDSDTNNEDWADYLIQEKKSVLSKVKEFLGADVISSKKKGNVFSVLDSPNGLYKIRYKYAVGSRKPMEDGNESRDFCRNMMNMSNRNVVWTIEDIDRATDQGVNQKLGHKGKAYDLFKFKGGIYCRHKFVRVLYRLESNTEPSNNLNAYKKTRKIPTRYDRNPRGSKQAKIAPENMPKRGAYPK